MKTLPSNSRRKCRAVFLGGLLGVALTATFAQPADSTYLFSHFAGAAGGPGAVDGLGSAARFNTPDGVAVDNQGNTYVVDSINHTIRKIFSTGLVTTFAGLASTPGNTDGTGSAARFSDPHGIAVDSTGNIYVADSGNSTIRKITPGGVVTTFAGRAGAQGSADGAGSSAEFWYPRAIAIDRAGTFYVADNSTIRKITPGGLVSTLAGTPGPWGFVDGTASVAKFFQPCGIAVNSAGVVYVADTGNSRIRKITPDGTVTTLKDNLGTPINLYNVHGIAIDTADTLYATVNYLASISKITLAGEVSALAGPTTYAYYYDPLDVDGPGTVARFNFPYGIAVDSTGVCYVADSRNHSIRKITPTGMVTTFAGLSNARGSADGTGANAQFDVPSGLTADSAGNIYVADSNNNEIRKITPGGVVTTLAGAPGYFSISSQDGTGSAARFYYPQSVAVDTLGTLYVADSGNNAIRKITPAGVVTTYVGISGWNYGGYLDAPGSAARFRGPNGVAVDANGIVYVADSGNCIIRKITPDGLVSTLAGTASQYGSADGIGASARFAHPNGIAVDKDGMIYVSDNGSLTIRKITPSGVVTTLAGTAGVVGNVDGIGSAAQFRYPNSLAVDRAGNVYVTESTGYPQPGYGNTIRKITPNGVVTTIAGSTDNFGSEDGLGFAAKFSAPYGITVDSANNLYISDAGNNAVRP